MCPISIPLAKFFYVITLYVQRCPHPPPAWFARSHVVGPKCGKRRRSGSELNCPAPRRSANSQDVPFYLWEYKLYLRFVASWLFEELTRDGEGRGLCSQFISAEQLERWEPRITTIEYMLSICCTSRYFWGPHIFCSHKLLRVGNTPSIMPKSSVESPGSQLKSKFRPFFSADLTAAKLTVALSTKDARVACLQWAAALTSSRRNQSSKYSPTNQHQSWFLDVQCTYM